MKKGLARLGLVVFGVLGAVAGSGAVVGATTSVPVIEVTRRTKATRQQVWELWADASNRTEWDEGLEYAKLHGPFRAGSTGEVKLKKQPARKFLITRCEPLAGYTDRFYLPLGGRMDWHHAIREAEGGLEVAFEIEVSGPTALILAPVMKNILRKELPPTVEKLVRLAEDPRSLHGDPRNPASTIIRRSAREPSGATSWCPCRSTAAGAPRPPELGA